MTGLSLNKQFPEDYMSDREVQHWKQIGGPGVMSMSRSRSTGSAQESVHDLLRQYARQEAVDAFLAHLAGRGDVSPADLEALGNRICRMAWEMERG